MFQQSEQWEILFIGNIQIMVIGSYSSVLQSDVEILSIGSDNPEQCDKPANLHLIDPGFGDGAFFNNLPTVCQDRSCVTYSFEKQEWQTAYQLSLKRDGLRAVAIDETTGWVTGGRGLSSTEVLANGQLTPGSELPLKLYFHCVVKVNETHIFFAGGRSNEQSVADAFLFDWPNQEWQKMPDMSVGRDLHACALLQNPAGVIALGGMDYQRTEHKTSEIFDLRTESWSQGPDMPNGTELFGMQAVEYQDTFLMLGGCPDTGSRNVYQFDRDSLEWITREETLTFPRCDHVAFKIPNGACAPGQEV